MTDPKKLQAQRKERIDFINAQIRLANQFSELADGINRTLTLWENLNYQQEISDDDLVSYRFSREQLIAYIGMIQGIAVLVESANYRAVNDQIRDISASL